MTARRLAASTATIAALMPNTQRQPPIGSSACATSWPVTVAATIAVTRQVTAIERRAGSTRSLR
jgi:hypothetical protein